MSSGAITNPKDLSSLQHEVGALDRRISTLEDEELEIMEQLEEAQRRLSAISIEVDRISAELEHEASARDAAVEVIDAEAVSVREERDELVGQVPDDLRDLYDKVRSQHGGLGAAALRARRCEGCHLEINGADLRELADKPDDEVAALPGVQPHPGPHGRVRAVTASDEQERHRRSGRRVAGQPRVPPPMALSSATPTPARCWPPRPRRWASPRTTSPSTAA